MGVKINFPPVGIFKTITDVQSYLKQLLLTLQNWENLISHHLHRGGLNDFGQIIYPSQANNTILGNNSGSTAAPSALTSAQIKTMLNVQTTWFDNFNTTTTLPKWATYYGAWQSDGSGHLYCPSPTSQVVSIVMPASYIVNGYVQANVYSTTNYQGITARVVDSNNFYRAVVHRDGSEIFIEKMVNGVETVLATLGSLSISGGEVLRLTFYTVPTGVYLQLDWKGSVNVLNIIDTGSAFPNGGMVGICMYNYNTSTYFMNFLAVATS